MTVDVGHGTVQMSGLYEDLVSECQLLSEPRLSPHQFERSLSFRARRGLARFCVLCQGVSIVSGDGNGSFAGDIYGFVVMTVPFNGQISL